MERKCYLLLVSIFYFRLFASPSWVWEVATQGTKFALHQVAPASLFTDYIKDEVEIK